MELRIKDDAHLLCQRFGDWLCKRIKDELIVELNPKKLVIWDQFLNTKQPYDNVSLLSYNTLKLVIQGIDNLVCTYKEPILTIGIDNSIKVDGLSNVTLSMFCKFVNYGNRSIEGYPIFSNKFISVKENFNRYLDLYINSY